MSTATDADSSASRSLPRRRRTLYRGDPGMWSWVLHRITGATIFFFLFVHVLDTALVRVSPEAYNEVIETYKTPIIGLMEMGLVVAVLYHALNGVRIILIDFWQHGPQVPAPDAVDRARGVDLGVHRPGARRNRHPHGGAIPVSGRRAGAKRAGMRSRARIPSTTSASVADPRP